MNFVRLTLSGVSPQSGSLSLSSGVMPTSNVGDMIDGDSSEIGVMDVFIVFVSFMLQVESISGIVRMTRVFLWSRLAFCARLYSLSLVFVISANS